MTAKEITNAVNVMSAQLQQVQTALAAEQVTTADLRQSMNRGGDPGIIGAIRRAKEVRQHASKSRAQEMKDYLFWHDRLIKGDHRVL